MRHDSGLTQKLLLRQVHAALLVVLVLLPLSLLRLFEVGFKPIHAVQWFVFLAILGLFLLRRRYSLSILGVAVTVVLVLWILTAVGNYGVLAPAHVITPLVAIFASVLFGRRVALLFLGLTCAGLVIIGLLYLTRTIHYQVDVLRYVQAPSSWIILLVGQAAFALWYLFLIEPIHETQRKASEQFEAVLQGINDALFIHDKDTGAILQMNQKACQMYGYSAEQAVGLNVGAFSAGTHPYTEEVAQEWMRKAIQHGPQLFAWQARSRVGILFWVEVNMRLATLGGTERLLVVARDISERRRLEEQLRQSQKMDAIGSLAGGVAHDFNNLLAVILSCTEFAIDELGENHQLRSDLQEVQRAAERATALTRQLLAFSRKQVMKPVPLNLNTIAKGLEKMLRRILGEDIDFDLTLAQDLELVEADPGQIEQVIMNLVVNARDAMPKGGRLVIETTNVEFDEPIVSNGADLKVGRYVQLAVSDNGCGMDAQTRERIFEPFFTTKETGKGTGLGLPTVHGIIQQSGGSIWVSSELGRGATFRIYLPVLQSERRVATVTPPAVVKPSRGNEVILLVEDEEALRIVIQRALENAGYTVLVAADGFSALSMSAQYSGEIQLLLSDVVMPKMSGPELATQLAASRPATPILYMSGYTDHAIVHHGVLDAGTNFLEKPFTRAQLIQKVEQVLSGSRTRVDGDSGGLSVVGDWVV